MTASTAGTAGSQTLSRGIRILEVLAASERDLTIDELAVALGVHRSVAYRLLRTLESHGLVIRDAAGRVALGTGLAALAAGVARDLQQIALPELNEVADELGMTCLIAVLADPEEAVTLVSAAPRRSMAVVSYRPGHRHPITRGGPGKAILQALPDAAWPDSVPDAVRAEIDTARARGYAVSHDEVVSSLRSVAVPLTLPGQLPASIAVIHVSLPAPEAEIAARLTAAADAIARAYGA
ncbi:IclR family transcriptional regulator [Agromyces archimandritae]|uniref:Helix-turn-helix domain-containing protein n=1 Tax=Agromyces archimandritae TaxID=2781962 RepID=A0A975FQ35_9MICO|nr:helix-turn-helix domain-containing protein [Agromyces archimandritae]QTX05952.1 helix-turn-helix domain-containing protein [Agromyces archimandritae]